MKTLQLLIGLLFSNSLMAADYIKVGITPNQIHFYENQLYTINSGFQAQPSISKIDLHQKTAENFLLPVETNPYRGVVLQDELWLTFNITDELIKLSLNNLPTAESQIDYQMLFQPDLSTTSAESVAAINGQVWVAYVNLQSDWKFKPGKILIYDQSNPQTGPTQEIHLAEKNPKELTVIANRYIAISTGEYGSKNGYIILIDTNKMPSEHKIWNISAAKHPSFVEYTPIGATPGNISFDGNKLWTCDLDWSNDGKSQVFSVDLQTKQVETTKLAFSTCGLVVANENYIYITHLNGGETQTPGIDKEHLFILDKNTKQKICALELLPENIAGPRKVFPSDLKFVPNQSKLVVSLSSLQRIAVLDLDSKGLPKDCQ